MELNNRVSITVCGDGGCGKSSITLRLVRSAWTDEYDPTIEDSYSVTRIIDGSSFHLNLTDTAGQEEYRGLFASSNLSSDAFLLVYDITSPASLDALSYYIDLIQMEEELRIDSGKTPPVKMVVGNKCDLQGMRQVSSEKGLKWARERGCGFMETSAREMVNIEETFAQLVRRVVEARRQTDGYALTEITSATAPLPPMKSINGHDRTPMNEKSAFDRDQKEGFWRKLKCW